MSLVPFCMRTFSEASLFVSIHVGIVTQYMSVCSLPSHHSICYMDMLYNSRRAGFMLCLAGVLSSVSHL